MAAVSFCQAQFSWSPDKPVNAIRYSFIDFNLESENENPFHGSTYDSNGCLLELVREIESPVCYVNISCCNPGSAQVNGFCILSESRTLEISNSSEGYISTTRGQKVYAIDEENVEDHQNKSQLYRCSYVFSKSQTDFQVKFMSLGNKDRLLLQSLTLNIQQHLDFSPKKAMGTFDMDKLKRDIEDMGDSVSERALDFLKTMELYEQNKSKTLGKWFDRNDQDNSASLSKASHPFSNGYMPSSDMLCQGLSSIMESVLGQDTISSLAKNNAKNDNQENGNIYSMLQAVCGEVSKRRKPLPIQSDVPEKTDTEQLNVSSGDSDSNKKQSLVLNADIFMQVEKRLEEAKTEIRMEIQSAKEEVMSELYKMNQAMETKMDLILQLLQNNLREENVSEFVAENG